MSPALLDRIVRFATRGTTFRASERRSRFKIDVQIKPLELAIKSRSFDVPRRNQSQSLLKELNVQHLRITPCTRDLSLRPEEFAECRITQPSAATALGRIRL